MGNCATVQVGAYVESCVGKPCSSVCPTGSCPNAGWVCNSGVCNAPYVETADCSISTNYCNPSCLDRSTCTQCPSKAGCPTATIGGMIDVPGCTLPCPTGYVCNDSLHQCVKSNVNPEYDSYGCDKSKGETWCAVRTSCHIESTDPCNPIVPVGGYTPPGAVVTPTPTETATDTITIAGLSLSPQMLAIVGIALLGGFVMMSSRK